MFQNKKSKKNLVSSITSENAKLVNKSESPSTKLNGSAKPTSIKSSSITRPSYSSIPILSTTNELNESRSGTANALKISHHSESAVFTEDFRSCTSGTIEDFEPRLPKRKMFLSTFSAKWMKQISGNDGFGSGYDDYESSSGIIVLSIVAFVMYLMIGAVAFCWYYEHWNLIDAMYFTVVTFTTCGYGDIVPEGNNERLFTIFFIIIGIIFLGGIFLTVLFDNVFGAYEHMIEEAKEKTSKQFMKESIAKVDRNLLFINEATSVGTNRTTSSLSNDTSYLGAICSMMPFIFLIMTSVFYMGYLEGWDYVTCIYFFVVTATSVGYGDVVPESQQSKLFAVLLIPSSVMVIAELFNRLIAVYLKRRADECEEEFLNRRMTLADFHQMDVDNSGTVTYDEFIKFFLVTMGKVKEEDMDRLKNLYDKFDANGDGDIQIEDLIMIAEENKKVTIGNITEVIKESKC